jgi:pyrroloquinoline quinone biosynthesis protein B
MTMGHGTDTEPTQRTQRCAENAEEEKGFFLCALCVEKPVAAASGVYAMVLGIAQDGGVPHIGCRQDPCVAARKTPARRQRVAPLGRVGERSGPRYLNDATPDTRG